MKLHHLIRDRRLWFGAAALAAIVRQRATRLSDHLSLETLATHHAALRALGAVFITLAGGLLFGAVGSTTLSAPGVLFGLAALSLAAMPLKARFARG